MFSTPKNTAIPTYTFGSIMVSVSKGEYRYGFNGKETDNEIKGSGNGVDFSERMHDTRLGRWLSMDPKFTKYPGFSPYNYCANAPFIIIDKYGEDLIVFGSDQSFQKFKAVLESQFHGLIEIKRDENNKVIMHVRETEALASGSIGVDKQVITNIIEAQKKKEAFIQLDKIISDNCITNVNLVDDDPSVKGGRFRGGELGGSAQTIDVGDAYIRKDWTFANGAGAIIHELVEAHQDQVVNGSKNVKDEIEFNKEFLKNHIPALEAQAKVSGFDKQINQKRRR